MVKELKLLQDLEDTTSKSVKSAILSNNKENTRMQQILSAVFDADRRFFIKKIDKNNASISPVEEDKHEEFMKLLSDLETGNYRGEAASLMVHSFLGKCSELEAKWYTRIIKKDLKAGFSAKTANKNGFDVPEFDAMLAKDAKNCKKLDEIIKRFVWLSPKLDGYRCIAFIDNGDVTLVSRNGNQYENFPLIEESLAKSFPTGRHILDGEIMSDDFQAMQKSAFANKRGTTVGDVKYWVFGYIPWDEWQTKRFKMNTDERVAKVAELHHKYFDHNYVRMVNQTRTDNLDYILHQQNVWEQMGYEGAMVVPSDIPYYLGKKSNKMLKFKKMKSQDCKIIDLYEGKEDSRLEGTMGGVVVVQENGEQCECGSGWNDEDRKTMWANPELFIGNIIEVKYQELTKDGIMRFPIFVRWRNDKI